jgi:CubicO group peptidase (beta-lactamase class C family)
MGFQNYSWFKAAPNGLTEIAGSISLRPRDMAKLGEMILRKGKWNGQRIVSENWLEQCTKPQAPPPPEDSWWDGYGYLFWRKQMPYKNGTIQVIFTAGRGGQYIFMVPDLDLVCVMTGGNYDDWKSDLLEQQFFKSYILGAVK